MERKRVCVALIAVIVVSAALAESIRAQAPAPPAGAAAGPRVGRGRPGGFGPMRQQWREMSPDDRTRFRSNAERWLRLPPEERRMLRERETLHRERVRREADQALEQSGLQLQAEKRELYERRYLQERRRIERGLRQELREKRKRELGPVVESLKKEFSDGEKSAIPTAGASGSPTPPK